MRVSVAVDEEKRHVEPAESPKKPAKGEAEKTELRKRKHSPSPVCLETTNIIAIYISIGVITWLFALFGVYFCLYYYEIFEAAPPPVEGGCAISTVFVFFLKSHTFLAN